MAEEPELPYEVCMEYRRLPTDEEPVYTLSRRFADRATAVDRAIKLAGRPRRTVLVTDLGSGGDVIFRHVP